MSKRKCAFLTMEDLSDFVAYDHLAVEPLGRRGWSVEEVPWTHAGISWSDFSLVVIRSPWDYQDRPQQFLEVLQQIDASTARLENPLSIVRWNLSKTYLRDLEHRGVDVVPTIWKSDLSRPRIEALYEQFGVSEIIIKPVIGANADDTFRLAAGASEALVDAAVKTFRGRPFMAQPFLTNVLSEGEYSLFYFGGQYSHAIVKVPKPGDFRVQEEHGGRIRSVSPEPDLLAMGRCVLQAIPKTLLYARVDLVRTESGDPLLMELELIEPSLYFAFDPAAPERFAEAVERIWLS